MTGNNWAIILHNTTVVELKQRLERAHQFIFNIKGGESSLEQSVVVAKKKNHRACIKQISYNRAERKN